MEWLLIIAALVWIIGLPAYGSIRSALPLEPARSKKKKK